MTENSNSIYVAVFGHYDSRGGTVAVRLSKLDDTVLVKAFDVYDSYFGYDPETRTTTQAGAGREVDQIVQQLLTGGERPSVWDFLFVAQLHDPTNQLAKVAPGEYVDLNYGDNHNANTAVVIDEATDFSADPDKMREFGVRGATEFAIIYTAQHPVQLEIVLIPGSFEEAIDRTEREIGALATVLTAETTVNRDWNDDACGFVLLPEIKTEG